MISQEVLLQSNYSVLRNFLSTTRFFYKIHIYEQRQAEIGKRIKQKLRNTLRLHFLYLKMICFLHPRYHSKVIGNILKNIKKQVFLFKRGYMINDNENEAEIKNRSH